MRNKKADLVNNVLTTIIAVVGLALILYAAWRLYSAYANQDATNAQSIINTMEARANAIQEGQSANVVVRGVKGWFIAGWSKDDKSRPESCYFKSCVCICSGVIRPGDIRADGTFEQPPILCQQKGFCRLVDANKVEVVGKSESYSTAGSGGAFGSSGAYSPPETKSVVMPVINMDQSNLYEIKVEKIKGSGGSTTLKLSV